jgi:hypothetical protein
MFVITLAFKENYFIFNGRSEPWKKLIPYNGRRGEK